MKKLLAIALIAASFTACNGNETKTEEKAADTTVVVAPTVDTVVKPVMVDTASKMAPAAADTASKMAPAKK